MADPLLLLAAPDAALLLVEQGEAGREVAGHQVCVLEGGHVACRQAQQELPMSSSQFHTVHVHAHVRACAHTHTVTCKKVC